MLTLLRSNRHFSIFLATQATSNLGDAARNVIVPLLVLQLTHSPALVAAVLLVHTATSPVLRFPSARCSTAGIAGTPCCSRTWAGACSRC